jgi:hypothetical protein
VVGVAEAMDLISTRRQQGHRQGRGADRGLRAAPRPRPQREGARAALPAGHPADTKSQVPHRRVPRAAARPRRRHVARRHQRWARRRRPRRARRPGAGQADADAVVTTGGDRDRARRRPVRKAGWTRVDLTGAINAAVPDYLGLPDGTEVGRLLDQLTDEALKYATCLDDRPPRGRASARGPAAAQRRLGVPGARLAALRHARARPHRARPRGCRHRRRRRGAPG